MHLTIRMTAYFQYLLTESKISWWYSGNRWLCHNCLAIHNITISCRCRQEKINTGEPRWIQTRRTRLPVAVKSLLRIIRLV